MALFSCLKFEMGSSRRRSKRVDPSPLKVADDHDPLNKKPPTNCNNSVDAHMIKRYSWPEIHRIIAGNSSRVIGEGGFSTVYLAHLNLTSIDPQHHRTTTTTPAALKIHTNTSTSERLSRLFKQELHIMLQIRHPNIVKLLGYCDEQEESALVLEYIPNGSLHDKLHDDIDDENNSSSSSSSSRGGILPWKKRMRIAFQLAQAIDYLHSSCHLQIVHGDIKSSNVLLDDQLNCRLCDLGSAKMGFSSSINNRSRSRSILLAGSPGYIDPHYLRTGIASKKNDVYSYGVILLELITGMEAFSSHNHKLLTSILDPILKNVDDHIMTMMTMGQQLAQITDPRLATAAGGFPPHQELVLMTSLAARCIRHQPSLRPSMVDILGTMSQNIDHH
ncbi:hypothetical protein Sjap_005866 [Stephania japonica]|uniref:Protein kinase domain-containing protein n=1 Tax=Stephania japonica TaxID=461633 RepID=A0AAP0K4U7_9MAGN